MRHAFVLQLGSETETGRLHFVGVVEEVDTGRELRFKSTEDLLAFLAQCFDDTPQGEATGDGPLRQ